jgi:hypothetical protein
MRGCLLSPAYAAELRVGVTAGTQKGETFDGGNQDHWSQQQR